MNHLIAFAIVASLPALAGAEDTDGGKDLVQEQVQSIDMVEDQLGKEESAQDSAWEAGNKRLPGPVKKPPQQIEYKRLAPNEGREALAIVQLTLLPKSGRFYWGGSGDFLLNDIFYKTVGLDARIGYFFNETWGAEAEGLWMTSQKGQELQDLEDKQRVTIENLVYLKNFYGASIIYSPIYGKMTLWNRKIYPIEIYGILGFGKVGTGAAGQPDGLKVGIGQIFALNKNRAVKLELNMLSYTAKNALGNTQSVNSLILSVGFEQFFNKASER